jgi:hypothetical protein
MPRPTGYRHLGRRAFALLALSASAVPVVGLAAAHAASPQPAVCIVAVADDGYDTAQDTPLTVADPGVTSNDTLCGTDGLVISATQPTHGVLSDFDDSGGGFTYTPDPGFSGTDTFTYTLEDVQGSPTGTVTITVSPAATTTTTTLATTTTAAPAATEAVSASPAFTG